MRFLDLAAGQGVDPKKLEAIHARIKAEERKTAVRVIAERLYIEDLTSRSLAGGGIDAKEAASWAIASALTFVESIEAAGLAPVPIQITPSDVMPDEPSEAGEAKA